ncbi:MAG: dTDP-4-dehydrorhamnose reductase [Burkholderiales bacterium]|jgi:dTDP-4-dehydrorhamnose reductase|nr:dTDP-4-dehydrorhamnose reductase [Burkholderiales bacterium]
MSVSGSEVFSRILLVGSEGQIGGALARQLPQAFPQAMLSVTTQDCVDFTKPETLVQAIREFVPDLIINAVAYTAVDRAEQEPALAHQINGVAPGILAEEARLCGAALIHYSTDYVFDGSKRTPYVEDDAVHPLNEYGRSKHAGEAAILQSGANALILRTSWVYGLTGHNFLLTMRRLARERDELRIVDDQIGAPNDSEALAAATAQLVAQGKKRLRECAGLYHLSATGETSWFGFAQAIFVAEAAILGDDRKQSRLIPITTADYPLPAIRPAYGVLSSERLSQTFGIQLPSWQAMLQACLAREQR